MGKPRIALYQLSAGFTECSNCPAGFSCPAISTPPEPCKPGKYQPFVAQKYCKLCPSGTFQPYAAK